MNKIILGNSNIEIPKMGLGLMGMSPNVYGKANDEESLKVIDRAIELDVNLLDTADTYDNGHNEELVSKVLDGRRNDIILASKFGYGENWKYIGAKPSYVKSAV